MAQNQNVNIKATVEVNSQGVDQYNKKLDETAVKTEQAFNPKRALREANLELIKAQEAFGVYSTEATKAARKVADLRDQIQDAKEVADLFDPGRKFAAYSNALQSAAGAFAGVQGAIGLLGVESKEVEAQLLKVQSALALSEGLSVIGDIGKNFQELGLVIKTQVVGAFTALRAAIGATGIGLLVVALGAIVANWDKIKSAITGVSKEQEDLNAKTAANVDAQKKKLESLDGQENILKLQGKSEKDILNIKLAQTKQVIEATKEQIRQNIITLQAQVEAEKRNKAILKGLLEFLVAPTQLVVDLFSKAAKLLGQDFEFDIAEKISSFVFDPKQVEAEGQAAIDEQKKALKQLENNAAGFQLQIQQIDKQAAEEAAKRRKEEREKREKEEQEEFERRKAKIAQNNAEIAQLNKGLSDNRKAEIKIETDELLASIPKRIEAVKQVSQSEEQLTKQKELTREANRNLFSEEIRQRNEALQKYAEGFNIISNGFGKQTAIGKAAAIAETTINTYLGAQKAYASLSGIPIVGPVLGGIAAAAAISAGIKNIREITKVKTPGGGGGGVSAPNISTPSISAPNTSAPIAPAQPQAQTTTLDQTSINQLSNISARAYVVESDVTNSQERVNRINRAARFG